jgi:hypothetical protein
MDIRNNTLKVTLSIIILMLSYKSFAQYENVMSKEMNRFSVNCELTPELDKILDNLKPEDQKLIFTVNTFMNKDTCQISLTTGYDVEIKNTWVGFFEYKNKLFLLESIEYSTFFSEVGRDTILLNIRRPRKSNDIIQSYIDNLPYWFLEYYNGRFTTKISSY